MMSDPRSFLDGRVTLFHGDCREVLKTLADNSVDSIVTDPPYHLQSIVKRFGAKNAAPAQHGTDGAFARAAAGFLGKQWDGGDIAFQPELWAEVLRVLKPGAACLSFGSDRTEHLVACAMEEAGFEIQGKFLWVTGQGFPKSRNISRELLSLPWCSCGVGAEIPPDIFVSSGSPSLDVSATARAECVPRPFDRLFTNPAERLGDELGSSARHGRAVVDGGIEKTIRNLEPVVLTAPDMAIMAEGDQIGCDISPVQLKPETLRNEMMGKKRIIGSALLADPITGNNSIGDILPSPPFVGPPTSAPCRVATLTESVPIADRHTSTRAIDGLRITGRKEPAEFFVTDDANELRSAALEPCTPFATEYNGLTSSQARLGTEFGSGEAPEEVDSTLFAGFGRHAKIISNLASERKVLICEICGSPKRPAWVCEGLGTGLKPAVEFIIRARKPISESSIAANVLRWGTGAINVGACTVGVENTQRPINNIRVNGSADGAYVGQVGLRPCDGRIGGSESGRWPANLITDGSEEVLSCFPETCASSPAPRNNGNFNSVAKHHEYAHTTFGHEDNGGSAARFFASFPQDEQPTAKRLIYTSKADQDSRLGSMHPTVKPLALLQYLVRLVTPKGGTCLDFFAGTGTTAEAAYREGFKSIICEREAEYIKDIERRMSLVKEGPVTRAHAGMKARGRPQDNGPLFGEIVKQERPRVAYGEFARHWGIEDEASE